MIFQCWSDLPGPCLQEVASHLASATDAAAVRLVCKGWSKGVSLPCISFSLAQAETATAGNASPRTHVLLKLQSISASLQQPCSAAIGARRCLITVPAECLHALAAAGSSSCQQPVMVSQLTQISEILTQIPSLQHVLFRTTSSRRSKIPTGSNAAEALLSIILQPLLLHNMKHKLTALTLNLHFWPAPQGLSDLLQQLPGLRCLALQRCPLAVLCSLPPLPGLQQLTITGLLQEPVPPGYSYKHRPMLPPLAQLSRLVLRSLPLDLRVQESEAIATQQTLARKQQQQQEQGPERLKLQKLLLMGLTPAAARASASRQSSSAGNTLGPCQWVGSSIVQQCPSLRELHTDFELGPVLLGLKQLTSLHGAHPAWLEKVKNRVAGMPLKACRNAEGCLQH